MIQRDGTGYVLVPLTESEDGDRDREIYGTAVVLGLSRISREERGRSEEGVTYIVVEGKGKGERRVGLQRDVDDTSLGPCTATAISIYS